MKRPGSGNLYPLTLLATSLIRSGFLSTDCSATTQASIDGGMQRSVGSRNLSHPDDDRCAPLFAPDFCFEVSIQCLIQNILWRNVLIDLQGNGQQRSFSG